MQTIAKKVVQNWAAKGYISDDEVEMCLYNLIRHTFTVAVLCVLTVVGALLGEWSNTIVLIVSILFLRTYTNGYHCKSCVIFAYCSPFEFYHRFDSDVRWLQYNSCDCPYK